MSESPSSFRNDRYAVIRLLGEGSQAATFEAVDKKEGKPVAVKRFRVRGAKSWKEVELAEREARVLASLSHPGLPKYIEHFEENGELFLVTEKIEGESLLSLQKRGVSFSEDDILRFLRETGEMLDYLHGRSPPVVHRDIKPSNVMRRPDGSFALIDFGAVRDKMKPEGGSTVVGTFGFMAPEQFQGRAMPASDVYAVGATALAMMTGRQPEDLPHKGLALDVATALGKTVHPTLILALTSMLEPDPDKRAAQIGPLLGDLRNAPRKAKQEPPKQQEAPKAENDKNKEEKGETERKTDKTRKKESEIEKDIEQGIEEAVEQLEQGFTELKKEWENKASKHESKAERKARKAERKAERAARRAERLANLQQGRPGLPVPLAGLFLFGLTLAQIAVLVSLRAVVPTLLSVLSIFFGKPLREAAARVREAGVTAHEALERGKRRVRGQTEKPSLGVRVAVPKKSVRIRFVEDENTEIEVQEEMAAEEEAADEEKQRRRR